MAVLALDEVTLDYGALRAVDHVSLELAEGEICGLVGPNGSGKSSLLNTISGFVPIADGAIRLGGDDVSAAPAHAIARRGAARTFQLVRLLPGVSTRENVAAGCLAAPHGRSRGRRALGRAHRRSAAASLGERVSDALERTAIAHYAPDYANELPFGTQRRVEIARAIVGGPRLVLFDEPAAGMSESDLEDLEAIIKEEAARGCAVILVDHHLDFVLRVCPRIVVLNFGHLIFDGTGAAALEDRQVREAYVGT